MNNGTCALRAPRARYVDDMSISACRRLIFLQPAAHVITTITHVTTTRQAHREEGRRR